IEGGEPKQLTSGKFEVSDVRLSEDKAKFYFISSEGDLGQRHLYSMPVTGGPRVRITTMPGNNQATISPDEPILPILHSYTNRPPPPPIFPPPQPPHPPRARKNNRPRPPGGEFPSLTTVPTPE